MVRLSEKKQEAEWNHTAMLAAMLHNTNSKRPKKIDDFNPVVQNRKRRERPKMSISQFVEYCKSNMAEETWHG